jgi:hypothetical protein
MGGVLSGKLGLGQLLAAADNAIQRWAPDKAESYYPPTGIRGAVPKEQEADKAARCSAVQCSAVQCSRAPDETRLGASCT